MKNMFQQLMDYLNENKIWVEILNGETKKISIREEDYNEIPLDMLFYTTQTVDNGLVTIEFTRAMSVSV